MKNRVRDLLAIVSCSVDDLERDFATCRGELEGVCVQAVLRDRDCPAIDVAPGLEGEGL